MPDRPTGPAPRPQAPNPAPAKPVKPKLSPEAQAALIAAQQLAATRQRASSGRTAFRLKSAAGATALAVAMTLDVYGNGEMTWSMLVVFGIAGWMGWMWKTEFGSGEVSEETARKIKAIVKEHRAAKKRSVELPRGPV